MKSFLFFLILSINLFCIAPARCQQGKPQSVRTQVYTPEQELAGFKLADGFVIELVASERDSIVNPIDLTFDDAGRLWTQTAKMYPLDPVADIRWNELLKLMDDPVAQRNHPSFRRILDLYQGKTKGTDNVIVISDLYGKNKAKTSIWANGLTIPMSILPYKNGLYVAQGSELFFLNDSDRDGKADRRFPLLTGFGFTDTHTMAHVLVRAPGDWIHFSHGALNKGEVSSLVGDARLRIDFSKIVRMSLDAKKLELVNNGLNNIWGYQLRGNGQWYGSEANDLGYSVTPMEPGSGFPGIGNDHLRSYQPFVPPLHTFRVGGTGISGTAFADDASGSFPDEYKNVAFLANPITSTINAVKVIRNSDGTVTAQHLPDLLTSKDDWFRPVNIEFGPDGCLYIADWYNKIVSHNELPTTHPDRDKNHGRIWRIRHVSQVPRAVPNMTEVGTMDLVSHLKSPSLWEKRAAWHQITDRPRNETSALIPELIAVAGNDGLDEIARIHALWSLEGLKEYNSQLLGALLNSPLPDLRREAIRSLASFSLTVEDIVSKTRSLISDENPTVRAQVLRTLSETGKANQQSIDLLVRACKPDIEGNDMGGAYERKFERFLARKALEQYPAELHAYIAAPLAPDVPISNVLWAIQALPAEQKETAFLKFWPMAKTQTMDEPTFIGVAQMLKNKEISDMIKPAMEDPAQASAYARFALQNQSEIQSPELSELLLTSVRHLLKSNSPKDVDLALDVIGRYRIGEAHDAVVPLISDQATDNTIKLALKALEVNPEGNQEGFARVVANPKLSFSIRGAALNVLSRANGQKAQNALTKWIAQMSETEKQDLAGILSGSGEGSALLLSVYEKKLITPASFDLPAAERVVNANGNDNRAIEIMAAVKKNEEARKAAFKGKLTRYMAVAQKKNGSAAEGKLLFQTCLLCHQVAGKGQSIAPALDGSASREHEALLTAILDPDAAVESGYAVYRVTKKDGSSVEGYLVNKDERGTTIAFMGGSKVFIEAAAIRSQGTLGGRSFMVKGLIDQYSDKQVADLLAYIRTLK